MDIELILYSAWDFVRIDRQVCALFQQQEVTKDGPSSSVLLKYLSTKKN